MGPANIWADGIKQSNKFKRHQSLGTILECVHQTYEMKDWKKWIKKDTICYSVITYMEK